MYNRQQPKSAIRNTGNERFTSFKNNTPSAEIRRNQVQENLSDEQKVAIEQLKAKRNPQGPTSTVVVEVNGERREVPLMLSYARSMNNSAPMHTYGGPKLNARMHMTTVGKGYEVDSM